MCNLCFPREIVVPPDDKHISRVFYPDQICTVAHTLSAGRRVLQERADLGHRYRSLWKLVEGLVQAEAQKWGREMK